MALNLSKRGLKVDLIEKRSDLNIIYKEGRTINLIVSERGAYALRELDPTK
jgi:hypothetical protein